MGDVLQFPSEAAARLGFERVKSTYSIREICEQFGLPERTIRHWTDEGLIHTAPESEDGEVGYDFRALTQFARFASSAPRALRSNRSIRSFAAR